MPKTSSLRTPGRHIVIVTTASLPWMTGTSVNPLLRAAYCAHLLPESKVVLLIPWLAISEQKIIFPNGITFTTPDKQKEWVRTWVEKRTGFESNFEIRFYPARYDSEGFFSIFPVGDVSEYISAEEADVAILEEPEHLTWFHHGHRWTHKFRHVVGIMHTNYIDYIRRKAPAASRVVYYINRRMCSIHCHKVIKLSDAVQALPRESTVFCHGVPKAFLEVGDAVAAAAAEKQGRDKSAAGKPSLDVGAAGDQGPGNADSSTGPLQVDLVSQAADSRVRLSFNGAAKEGGKVAEGGGPAATGQPDPKNGRKDGEPGHFTKGAYFLGKGVWGKGYTELLDLLAQHNKRGERPLPVDVYGSGEDMEAIKAKAQKEGLDIKFHSATDHLDDALHAYRVFVNPSTSDVVATTSAEALAMGKWVVCAEHPSNTFFATFENCLTYKTSEEFSERLRYAEENDPAPLRPEDRKRLTWEDATERFLDAAEIHENEWPSQLSKLRNGVFWPIINGSMGIEAVRRLIGAGANTKRNPHDLATFDPAKRDITWGDIQHLRLGYPEPRLL